jgi:hemoglobin-like flavoprotein
MLVAAGATGGIARKELVKLAERHSRNQLAIDPAWYDKWLSCLLQAVSENDPEYRPELEKAWKESLSESIALMKSRY